ERLADLFEKRFAEGQDVGRSCPQRRELDIEDLQPIKEVLAKIAALERLFQIAIGRRNHTHVCLQRACRAESLELAPLQDTQELGLWGCAHLGDFVEKKHAARRQLDLPGLGLLRTSEGATLIA